MELKKTYDNEAILVRIFLGSLLGVLVTVAGVNLAPEQVESILALGDASMAILPLLLGLVGAVSARQVVDGPVTAQDKADAVARLQRALEKALDSEVTK